MVMNYWIILAIVTFFYCTACPATGNREYEEQIAARLTETLPMGQLQQIPLGDTTFIALYDEPIDQQPQGAVILLHGMGGHPDWPEVISPLRNALPQHGWATLSIQLPVLGPADPIADYGQTIEQARARIDAALQYLRERRYLNIVMIGYGFGAAQAADYLAENRSSRVKALIGISMQARPFLSPRQDLMESLGQIQIPLLDIYGSRDFYEVTERADERRSAARKGGNRNYAERVIEGADHYYTGLEPILIRQIRGWLDKAAPGVQVKADDEADKKTEEKEKPLNTE